MNQDCTCIEDILAVDRPVATQSVPEDSENIVIDVADVFSVDDADIELRPVVDHNSDIDTPVAEAELTDDRITVTPLPDRNGIQEFEIVASTEDSQTVSDRFAVVVEPVDDPLGLKQELPDIDFVANQNMISLKVDDFFVDPDADSNQAIAITIEANTNSELINVTLDGDHLIIGSDLTTPGEAEITLRGTSGNETVEDTFTVRVDANICIKDGVELSDTLLSNLDTINVISFDSSRGTRLYTAKAEEIDFLTGNESDDLELSNNGYRGLADPGEGIIPVERFYNQNSDSHFYSANQEEIVFVNSLDNYTSEGVEHYAYSSEEVDPDAIPLYRFYNQENGSHLFTLNQTEGSDLIPEGIAFYVFPGSV